MDGVARLEIVSLMVALLSTRLLSMQYSLTRAGICLSKGASKRDRSPRETAKGEVALIHDGLCIIRLLSSSSFHGSA
jgi:hypothetical protein